MAIYDKKMKRLMPEVMDKINTIVLESLSELLQEKFQKYDKVASSF